MKKVLQILSAAIVGASLLAGIASADTNNCSLVNTGPGSNNTCTVSNTNDLNITCTNDVDVVTVNGQDTSSGSATLTGNTDGGYSYSGNAVNTNGDTNQLDVGCAPVVAAVAPAPTPAATTPAAPAATPAATPAPAAKVASLPNTGSDTVLNDTLVGAATIGGTLAVAQLGVTAYRRSALK